MPLTFPDIPAGAAVYFDANILVFHLSNHPQFSIACSLLMKRIENQEIVALTSARELGDTAHRLMTIEAMITYGWPFAGIGRRLKKHPDRVQQLTGVRKALGDIAALGIRFLPTKPQLVLQAADISQQTGLLSSDALVVAAMRDQGLTHLASHDADFDRVPGIARYGPV